MVGIWLSVKLKNIRTVAIALLLRFDHHWCLTNRKPWTGLRCSFSSWIGKISKYWQILLVISEKFSTRVYDMTPRVELKHRTESNISGQLVGVASKVGCSRQRSSSSISSLWWKLLLESIFAYILPEWHKKLSGVVLDKVHNDWHIVLQLRLCVSCNGHLWFQNVIM